MQLRRVQSWSPTDDRGLWIKRECLIFIVTAGWNISERMARKDSEIRVACGCAVESCEISIYHVRPVGDVWTAPVYIYIYISLLCDLITRHARDVTWPSRQLDIKHGVLLRGFGVWTAKSRSRFITDHEFITIVERKMVIKRTTGTMYTAKNTCQGIIYSV